MKAAVLDGVGQPLVMKTVAEPVPAPGWAAVRLQAAALNHRDLWIQQGCYAGLKFPIILGSDGAGTVQAVGADADRAWVGRPVIINPSLDWGDDPRVQGPRFRILGLPDDGTLAEAVVVPVANLAPRPGHLSAEQAAALPLGGLTAWRALFARGGLRAGESVLVTGIGGGVALFGLQFALAAGATVYVTTGSAAKLERARALGAAGGVNYRETDWAARLQREAGEFDLVLDSAMGEGLAPLIDLTRPGGRIVFYGATTGNPPGLDARKVFWRQISLLGTTMGSPADFAGMLRLVDSRRLVPVIDTVQPLTDAGAALRRMESAAQFGKLVLTTG
ncbi:MAG TPA: zinc-binding dehydrogenase [Opitutaceae bacterium]|nr:zinc-binding dehydrogenase [Opitutaceae bacterium]